MKKNKTQLFSMIASFTLGLGLISGAHAALPNANRPAVQPLSELKVEKASSPELEQDFSKLSSLESRYAESAAQQQRLKAATSRGKNRSRN